jgi:hypothetical protein
MKTLVMLLANLSLFVGLVSAQTVVPPDGPYDQGTGLDQVTGVDITGRIASVTLRQGGTISFDL